MFKFRPLLGFLIGLIVYLLIWKISVQEQSTISTETGQYKSQAQYQYQQQPENSVSRNKNYYLTNGYLQNKNHNLSVVRYQYSAVNYEALQKDDISNLIDLQNFEFIINQKSCRVASLSSSLSSSLDTNHSYSKQNTDHGSPLLLILVVSAPGNVKKRLLIREIWSSVADTTTNYVRLLFLLGAVNETRTQHRIQNENKVYSDIVQGNFIDNYRNMTYKHVMALKWFTYYCPNAKYILKTDDDIVLHTRNLVNYLSTVADRNNLLFCQKQNRAPVKRNGLKWHVTEEEYSGDYYPPYCPGYSILYSADVAFRLYLEAQKTRYFWLDDVHVTGTLAKKANITIKSFEPVLLRENKLEDILTGRTDINDIPFLFVWPGITKDQTRKLLKLFNNFR